jgi:PPP family 3-phenylpropionic acid transporter
MSKARGARIKAVGTKVARHSLPRFLILYALFYGAFGVISPFLPSFFESRGLSPSMISTAFASGTMVRFIAGPISGFLADRFNAARLVFGLSAAASAIVAVCYLPAFGFWPILIVSLVHAVVLTPIPPLADALSLAGSRNGREFDYGWVRGAGSAAFIAGTLIAGQVIPHFGLPSALILNGALLLLAALAVGAVPGVEDARPPRKAERRKPMGELQLRSLLGRRSFWLLIFTAALILGSHAMQDTFAVIRWRAAGISETIISILWSESVGAEVAVFLLVGRPVIKRLGPANAAMLAASAAIVRWSVMATTTFVPALMIIQLLHGITFALLHLACMRFLSDTVPKHLSSTAQTIYGTFGLGIASAVITLASGFLYQRFGASAFWAMAALCVLALPFAFMLRRVKAMAAEENAQEKAEQRAAPVTDAAR